MLFPLSLVSLFYIILLETSGYHHTPPSSVNNIYFFLFFSLSLSLSIFDTVNTTFNTQSAVSAIKRKFLLPNEKRVMSRLEIKARVW